MPDEPDAHHESPVELHPSAQCACAIYQRLVRQPQYLSKLSQNPDYARRLEAFPAYKESLHLRYPPVCDTCLPAVEEEIQRKDHMARTRALGGWLVESKGKEKQRRVSELYQEQDIGAEMIVWRARGVLWAITTAVVLGCNFTAVVGFQLFSRLSFIQPILPIIVILSLLWTVWDPTYSSFRRAQRQGREARVRGKGVYIQMQMMVWSSRLLTSLLLVFESYRPDLSRLHLGTPRSLSARLYFLLSLVLELTAFTISCLTLRLQQPPAVRLLRTNSLRFSSSRSATPNVTNSTGNPSNIPVTVEPDLAALSLSSKPIITPTNPIFGLPSLLPSVSPISCADEEIDTDAMDWAPTAPPLAPLDERRDDGSFLRPQRFFAPEKPTGLEGLLERTLLLDDESTTANGRRNLTLRGSTLLRDRWWVILMLLASVGVAYNALRRWGGASLSVTYPVRSTGHELLTT